MKNVFTLSAGFLCIKLVATQVLPLGPTVKLDYGTFRGKSDLSTPTNSFLGMPFAVTSRLQNPRVIGAGDKLSGIQDATQYGDACPQAELVASPLSQNNSEVGGILGLIEAIAFPNITHQSEDCLSINVQIPKGTKPGDNLPVMMWIHGGGFELGASAALASEQTAMPGFFYQGANLVARSVEMDQPIVFVSANHRLNAFGTLASQEITDAGLANILLKDQRVAMKWIQKYIHKFGGDHSKVTIFGESAGSMAVAIHMLLNNGNPDGLFRAAIMMSGGPAKFDDYHRGQYTFDTLMDYVGCGNAKDKIDCFRKADYDTIYSSVQKFPNFFSYNSTLVPWYPRPDGKFLKASPAALVRSGHVADIPYIIGDMEDEGTLFCQVNQFSIPNDATFKKYFKEIYFHGATQKQVDHLASLYPQDPAKGSPFGTGDLYETTPQYKRLSALIGDATFQASRRDLLEYTAHKQPAWSYMIRQSIPVISQFAPIANTNLTGLPVLGSFHVSDVALNVFAELPATISKNTLNTMSTFIAFVNSLDPNNHGLKDLPYWPKWNAKTKKMFQYREDGPIIITDDYREEQMRYMNDHPEAFSF